MLALDVGNGSVKYARFDAGKIVETGRLAHDEDPAPLAGADRAVAVSVNPGALARLRGVLPHLEEIGVDLPLPLPVLYDPPADCGPDRVLGVFGALCLRPDAAGVLLLDAGTCLTATVGLRDEGVMGGAILPGPDLMAWALCEGTARLPRVTPASPAPRLGRSTAESIRSGIDAAVTGAARDLVGSLQEAFAARLDVVCAGTGADGVARSLAEPVTVAPHATLVGVHAAAG